MWPTCSSGAHCRGGGNLRCASRSAPASAVSRGNSSWSRWCSRRPEGIGAVGAGVGRGTGRGFHPRAGFRALPFRGEVPIVIDGRVLVFAAAAALTSAVIFGFAPLLSLRHRNPQALLREGDRGSTAVANVARRSLVAVEVALAMVVLCGAGLLVKSMAGLLQVSPGLDPGEVLTLQVSLPQTDTYGPPIPRIVLRGPVEPARRGCRASVASARSAICR